jgi:hypothetical protein
MIRGLGIDPSYAGPGTTLGGRLRFEKQHFCREVIPAGERTALVLLRHTLEHIPGPREFLAEVFAGLDRGDRVPMFIEVPDLHWTLKESAIWDFCYEHVNYFTRDSLWRCISAAGAQVQQVRRAFADQYLWAEVITGLPPTPSPYETESDVSISCSTLAESLVQTVERISEITRDRQLVIWGMAAKGTMYSLHLIQSGIRVDWAVDINPAKHGKFVPLSGLRVTAPQELPVSGTAYAVICMNPNYKNEIAEMCDKLGLTAVLYGPDGRSIDGL